MIRKSVILFILLFTILAQSCVYRGFGKYISDGDGGVYRSGVAFYLPWPLPYYQLEHCEPEGDVLSCREIKLNEEVKSQRGDYEANKLGHWGIIP